jgi:hypothetical protein
VRSSEERMGGLRRELVVNDGDDGDMGWGCGVGCPGLGFEMLVV